MSHAGIFGHSFGGHARRADEILLRRNTAVSYIARAGE
jgi:hypothetical protein